MFENYVIAKQTKRAGWVTALIVGSVLVHAGAGAGLLIYSWLKIEKLEAPSTGIKVGLDLPPPPPPPKGSRTKKLEAKKDPTPKKVKPVDTVQPEKREEKVEEPDTGESTEVEGDPDGEEGGVEGGVVGGQVGGVVGGVVAAPPPPPPPPPPKKVENVAPTALEAMRISGDKNIVPEDVTKTEIQRSGKSRLVIPVKICLSDTGTVKTVSVMKSSGFPKYDAKIKREMQTWKYRPFKVNGKAAPVCSAITLIYVQKS